MVDMVASTLSRYLIFYVATFSTTCDIKMTYYNVAQEHKLFSVKLKLHFCLNKKLHQMHAAGLLY